MSKVFHIAPRRHGKTQRLIENFFKHLDQGKDGFIVASNRQMQLHLQKHYLPSHHSDEDVVVLYPRFMELIGKHFGERNITKCFADEMLFLDIHTQRWLADYCKIHGIDLETWSTSNKLYKPKYFRWACHIKAGKRSWPDSGDVAELAFLSEMFMSPLTDPDTIIIHHACTFPQEIIEEQRQVLDEESFRIQVLGELFE